MDAHDNDNCCLMRNDFPIIKISKLSYALDKISYIF